jgi:thiamine-phosphate pyrophosphorylase
VPPTFSLFAISQAPGEDWFRALAAAGIADIAGIGAVQIREKHLEDRALWELTRRARAALPSPVRLLVNGRLDVALAAGADGVHLPSDGLPVAALRARFGPGVLIGRSTHRVEEVDRARDEGADYVTFGPVYETPGKGAPVGLAGLERAAASAGGLPVYALGGVTLSRFGELAGAGAAGVAGIRLFQKTSDLNDLGDLRLVARAAREHFCRP